MYILNKPNIIMVKISKQGFLLGKIHFKLRHATFVIFEIYTIPKTVKTFYYVNFYPPCHALSFKLAFNLILELIVALITSPRSKLDT
jgi:hypothetical protein